MKATLAPPLAWGTNARSSAETGRCEASLREAVHMLAALGVEESRYGSGVYVTALPPEELIGSLRLTVDLLPLSGLLEM